MEITKKSIAGMIDHTILKADASEADVAGICQEAKDYSFASVCINPCYVKQCAEALKGTDVAVCTVIGFPLGATTSAAKAFEAKEAIENGASEVDMVINVGKVKSQKWDYVKDDIAAVVKAADKKALVKVIIETCLLTDEEKVKVCTLAKEAGADYVKTSTGFSKWGAKAEDIALMRRTVGPDMGVKASGGIHNAEEAIAMINAGASRLGVSAGIAVVDGIKA